MLVEGSEIAILASGSMVEEADALVEMLRADGKHPSLVNIRFPSMLDEALIDTLCEGHKTFVTMEDNLAEGGYGQRLALYLSNKQEGYTHICGAIHAKKVEHGSVKELRDMLEIDAKHLYEKILAQTKIVCM